MYMRRRWGRRSISHSYPTANALHAKYSASIRSIMVFTSPEWVLELPFEPPDSIPISDFMLDEKHGRYPLAQSKPPFTCGISGVEYTALQVRDRVDFLARGLAKQFGWHPNQGTEWDKVVGVFSVNTVSPVDRRSCTRANVLYRQLDRYSHPCLGNTPPGRHFNSCKCSIFSV